ncbi:MAG TPA: hypothetical protein VHE12_13730 [bacterium]|nr:hypothetical protein [bacterium]
MKRSIERPVLALLAVLTLGIGRAQAGPKYFKDSYEKLQMKAATLQAHGTLANFHSDDATIKSMADAKRGMFDSFYAMAASYGHDDVDGSAAVLKNEARMNWDIKRFTRAVAKETLYNSEAALKFILEKDKANHDPKFPSMTAGYEAKVLKLVVQAESAFDHGKYSAMRNAFYQALWLAYPVTSLKPFPKPKN